MPGLEAAAAEAPLLSVRDLETRYSSARRHLFARREWMQAVDRVSFEIARGETLALVGESGSGKSTTGMSILRLTPPSSGEVLFRGRSVLTASRHELRELRRHMQVVLQSPHASLNQRMSVEQIIAEPLLLHRIGDNGERKLRVAELLDLVGLRSDQARRHPHEFSGGQRQRIAIARAIALEPDLLVADEPVSALDVSIQAQIINLLVDLQARFGLAYLFISHDLSIVRHIAHRVAVMYRGRIVEIGEKRAIYAAPRHPYTRALLAAAPRPVPGGRRARTLLQADLSPSIPPGIGCAFLSRCPVRRQECTKSAPTLRSVAADHRLACHVNA
jgi:peptide/nickel transport system ATP-binding protein